MSVLVSLDFETITCCHKGCGITFAVPDHWKNKRREDHSQWYCPNGHPQSFVGKTEAERLRDELAVKKQHAERLEAQLATVRDSNRSLGNSLDSAYKKIANAKKRAANGVCPCCHRTVRQLAAHMKSKHPDYANV